LLYENGEMMITVEDPIREELDDGTVRFTAVIHPTTGQLNLWTGDYDHTEYNFSHWMMNVTEVIHTIRLWLDGHIAGMIFAKELASDL